MSPVMKGNYKDILNNFKFNESIFLLNVIKKEIIAAHSQKDEPQQLHLQKINNTTMKDSI